MRELRIIKREDRAGNDLFVIQHKKRKFFGGHRWDDCYVNNPCIPLLDQPNWYSTLEEAHANLKWWGCSKDADGEVVWSDVVTR